jgi:hypothetical protein
MSDMHYLNQISPPAPASDKQLKFFFDLMLKKDIDPFLKELPTPWLELANKITSEIATDGVAKVYESKQFAKSDLHKFISKLTTLPDKPKQRDAIGNAEKAAIAGSFAKDVAVYGQFSHGIQEVMPTEIAVRDPDIARVTYPAEIVLEDGMYRNPSTGTIYKVYHTVHGNNVQVAKRLVVTNFDPDPDGTLGPDGNWQHKQTAKVKFKYEGRKPLYNLRPTDRLTMDEARELGALYGTCVICARTLTNELSIHLGIGPVCGRREFGGEFEFMIDSAKVATGAKEVIDVDDYDVEYHDTNEDKVRLINDMVKHGLLTEAEAEIKIKELS